jgi:beta-mannanase
MFGSFVEGGVWFGMQPIYDVEEVIEHQLNVVHWFHQWSDSWNAARVASVSQSGRFPMISWEPYDRPLQAIIDGQYDAYITSWARGAKAHGSLLYIQPFPEMNGYWKPWNGDPRRFVLAWRHIVDIFRAEGASNVRWIWTPNGDDNPNVPENRMENYYPGSDYVDILGVDVYNWGSEYSWSRWRTFDEMLSAPYRRITALGPQPFWVNEISSTEKGGNKGQWVREMFNTFYSGSYPRLQTVIWFDKYDSARGIDWRMQSSAGSLRAFQECLAVFGEASPRC